MISTTGRVCHHCGEPAEVQWRRHATDAEVAAHWNALERNIIESGNPDYVQDRTGDVHVTVFACGDHMLPMPCTHTEPVPVPCPVCNAEPGSPCTTPEGVERLVEHRERAEAQPELEVCTHAHAADCGGYGDCRCADAEGA